MVEREISSESHTEEVRKTLVDTVSKLGPEDLLTKEKADQIRESYESALDFFARDKQEALAQLYETNEQNRAYNRSRPKGTPRRKMLTRHDVLTGTVWPIQDVARTFLTHPLPGQVFEYEAAGEAVPEEAKIADTMNWWSILDDQQKRAFSSIIGFDLSQGDRYKPPFWRKVRRHIFATGKLMTVAATDDMPETSFYPILIWTGKSAEDPHGFALGVIPAPTPSTK